MTTKVSNFFIWLLLSTSLINCSQPKDRYFESIQNYMLENIDDPQKYEFVSLSKPDTVDIHFSEDYAEPAVDSSAGVYYDDQESLPFENDSTKILKILLKFRYTVNKEKYLFGKIFYFNMSAKLLKSEEQYLLNH